MEVLLFVLFWVLLAVTLVIVGLSAGRRRKGSVNTNRGGRAWWYAAFAAVLLVFGIGVPVAASIGNDNNSTRVAKAGISDLTAKQERGRELFGKYCRLCHTLAAAGAVADVGPNLDELRPTKGLVLDAIENGRSRGNGAMAADLVVGADADAVAEFVAVAVGQQGK